MSGDIEWRLKQMHDDMNIMWSRLNDLEEARDEKVEPYDVMDSFRATKPDAGEPVNRYLVDCLKENARLIEDNDVLKYQYETMHKEAVGCKVQIEQLQKTIADKQKVLEDVMDQRDRFNKENYKLHRELEDVKKSNEYLRGTLKNYEDRFAELEKANKYWEERVEKLQMENGDLRWRYDNADLVEYQTARECTEIVNRIKNEPLTKVSTHREWMVAICEDIEAAIKKEFNLNE